MSDHRRRLNQLTAPASPRTVAEIHALLDQMEREPWPPDLWSAFADLITQLETRRGGKEKQ